MWAGILAKPAFPWFTSNVVNDGAWPGSTLEVNHGVKPWIDDYLAPVLTPAITLTRACL